MTAPPVSGTSDATQPGLFHAYALVTATVLDAANVALVTLTVPGPAWFDVEATVQNWSATDGTIAQDSMNFVLESDPVTAATLKVARLLPVNPDGIDVAATLAMGTPTLPLRTRIYAQTTIQVTALEAATGSTSWLGTLTAREVYVPTDVV